MNGTDSTTGKTLSGVAHLRQSVRDILRTPLGSRVMRREYGSRLFALIDAPTNARTLSLMRAASADALRRWEPRYKISRLVIVTANPGEMVLDLYGTYLPDGSAITIDGIVIS